MSYSLPLLVRCKVKPPAALLNIRQASHEEDNRTEMILRSTGIAR